MRRFLFLVMCAYLVVGWEFSVAPFLPSWLAIHPFLPSLVLLLAFARRSSTVFFFAMLVGIGTTALAGEYGFFVPLFRACFVSAWLILLGTSWLSNRSLYALLLLVACARLTDWISLQMLDGISRWIGQGTSVTLSFFTMWHWLIWDLVLVSMGFLCVSWMKRNLRPYLPARFHV